jgi:hypothetical protein
MKKLLLFLFTSCFLGLGAQPIYTSAPEAGQRMIARILDANLINPTDMEALGTNLNWNVTSSDIIIQTPDTSYFVSMDNVPKKEAFPAANVALRYGNDSSSYFEVYRKSASKLEILGETDFSSDPAVVYNSPLTQLEYPLMFGDEFQDTATVTIQTDQGAVRAEITMFSKAEAWGRLKTTNNTFDCVKLAYRAVIEIFFGPIPIANQTIVSYRFLSPGYSAPVLVYNAVEEEFGGEVSNDTSAQYLTSAPIASTRDQAAIRIGASPNPAKDFVNIELDRPVGSQTRLAIFSPEGNRVYEENMTGNQTRISVANWPAGVYLIQTIGKDQAWGMQPLVIQK